MSRIRAGLVTKYLQERAHLGTRLIEVFDAIALAAFTVVGVAVVPEHVRQPLWLWGPTRPCFDRLVRRPDADSVPP